MLAYRPPTLPRAYQRGDNSGFFVTRLIVPPTPLGPRVTEYGPLMTSMASSSPASSNEVGGSMRNGPAPQIFVPFVMTLTRSSRSPRTIGSRFIPPARLPVTPGTAAFNTSATSFA